MSFSIENTKLTLDNTAVTIATPSAGQTVIYSKADKLLYYKDDAGVERLVNVTAGIGVGQTWQNMTASRVLATTYTNDTGRPIQVSVIHSTSVDSVQATQIELFVAGILVAKMQQYVPGSGYDSTVTAIVPAGATYSAAFLYTTSGGSTVWLELR